MPRIGRIALTVCLLLLSAGVAHSQTFSTSTFVAENVSVVASITSPALTLVSGQFATVFCRGASTATSFTITSSPANTFHNLNSQTSSGGATISVMAYATNMGSGSTTFTCTPNVSDQYMSMIVRVYTVATTGGVLDTQTGTFNNVGATAITSPAFSTSNANDIIIYCGNWNNGGDTPSVGLIGGTTASNFTISGSGSTADSACEDRTVSSLQNTITASMTISASAFYTSTALAFTIPSAPPPTGVTHYLSFTGNDSNSGADTSHPWLSPNHSIPCGDTIQMAASTSYNAVNFAVGKWGTVTGCGTGASANVARLTCIFFDACKITSNSSTAVQVSASNWQVENIEATTTSSATAGCFFVTPPNSATSIHHVIFDNNIANGCQNGGFSAIYNGSAGTDYIVYIGNIAYNAAQQGPGCASGFNIVNPVAFDSLSGTHDYVAGNFSWSTVDGTTCGGSVATDGEGFILDSIFTNGYTQQMVMQNNIAIGNGGRGFEVYKNNSGAGAPIIIKNNTSWDNNIQLSQTPGGSYGEYFTFQSSNVTLINNVGKTNSVNGPQGFPNYAFYLNTPGAGTTATTNDGFSSAGFNFLAQFGISVSFATDFTTDPAFFSPAVPSAPNCSSFSSTVACMATVISNFAVTGAGLAGLGYQTPSTSSVVDPLFPSWLCNVSLPSGLVTRGCGIVTGYVRGQRAVVIQ